MNEKIEVIHCKECSKWPYQTRSYADNTDIVCYEHCFQFGPKDYCSRAVGKEDANSGKNA